jgi:hypothetical protein
MFFAVWYVFLLASTKYYYHAISDVGAPLFSLGLFFATPIVFAIWIALDFFYSRKGASLKKLWLLFCAVMTLQILLSPLWLLVGLTIAYWVKLLFFR